MIKSLVDLNKDNCISIANLLTKKTYGLLLEVALVCEYEKNIILTLHNSFPENKFSSQDLERSR